MDQIRKITVQYIPLEDRLRFAAQLQGGESCNLWMTARLSAAVVACVLQTLGNQPFSSASVDPRTLQEWEQAAAMQGFKKSSAVSASPEPGELIESVDVGSENELFILVFRGVTQRAAQFTLTASEMRQWLQIVYSQFEVAGWSLEVWPDWFKPQQAVGKESRPLSLQ